MRLDALFATGERDLTLAELPLPCDLDALVAGGPWEVELGFGKGRFLLERAAAHPERRFLGVEVASKYFRMARGRARRRGLDNVLLVRGEALYLLSAVLPAAFAAAVHVYFPDPWPKSRHHKRRLFDPETVDLVLGLLRPAPSGGIGGENTGGELFFATDYLDYGELVTEILEGFPGLGVERLDGPWPDGPRTNYEAKYVAAGRPILRLHGVLAAGASEAAGLLHPAGRYGILVAPRL